MDITGMISDLTEILSASTSLRILVSLALFLLSIPGYFYLARKYNWLDIPNNRSSHQRPTYRGFGILFLNSLWLFPTEHYLLAAALILSALTGFLDDLKPLKAALRALLYGLALFMAIYSIPEIRMLNTIVIILALIVGLGTVNAVNFMDGINSISVFYALVFLITVFAAVILDILPSEFAGLWVPLAAILMVFAYLNARKKALVFMGDAGSVFLGMVIVYGIVYLCISTGTLLWTGLLMVYGVDSILTIVERLIKKENIFQAHRSHLYQLLSNELKFPHVQVGTIYAVIQVIINVLIFFGYLYFNLPDLVLLVLILVCGFSYLFIKKSVQSHIKKVNSGDIT